MAVIAWTIGIYIGLVVISLTLPYVRFRAKRKPNQETIGDYINWIDVDDGDIKYLHMSFLPILNILTALFAIAIAAITIVEAIYDKIKDIKIV